MSQIIVHSGGIQDRATVPDEPGASWPDSRDWYTDYLLAQRGLRGDVVVNAATAMTYAAVWRCVNYIASTIASLCWHVYETSEDGRTKLPVEDNIAWTLELQANSEMTALDWRQVMLRDALLTGNGYAEIERTNAGRPLWLWRVDPQRVEVTRDDAGRLVYDVRDADGGPGKRLGAGNVFHLKGLSPDGLVGYSPVAVARRAIELGLQQEVYGVGYFRRGPTPGGFLKVTGHMKEDERRAQSKSFSERHGGARNAGSVPVLSGGMEFVPFDMPNADAQWVESRGLQAEEICRIYGVPPHKAGIMTHSTFGNIEHQAIEAVYDCLYPWCRRLEVEADVKLYGAVNRGRRRTRLDLRTLLRGDSKTHTENLARQVQTALATPNEAREELDRNPVPEGDELLIQGATVPLERALEEPAPMPAPGGNPGARPPAEPDYAEPPADLAGAFLPLLSDVYGRLLKYEADKAGQAERRGRLKEWAEGHYTAAAEAHVAGALLPVVRAYLLAAGRDGDAEHLAATLAHDHVGEGLSGVYEGGVAALTNGRAGEQAARHLDLIWRATQ